MTSPPPREHSVRQRRTPHSTELGRGLGSRTTKGEGLTKPGLFIAVKCSLRSSMKNVTLALIVSVALPVFGAVAASADSSMMAAAKPVSVTMKAQNNSGETGTATLTQQGANVVVNLAITGAPAAAQPAHIHMATCAKL